MSTESLMDIGSDNNENEEQSESKEVAENEEQSESKEVADNKEADRPENVPEKFWDSEKKEIKVDSVLKSYSELEKKQAENNLVPEEYEVKIPEEFKDTINIPDDDPMLVAYKSFAKENGFNQKVFGKTFEFFVKFMAEETAAEEKEQIEALGGEKKAAEIAKGVRTFYKNKVSEETFDVLRGITTNSKVLLALDEIRKISSVQNPPADDPDLKVSEQLSEDELRALMKKPEYHDPSKRDPALVKKVEEGFKKLYPDKKG